MMRRCLGPLAVTALLAAACSAPPNVEKEFDGGTAPDGGTQQTDGGTTVAGPSVTGAERIGAYLPARIGTVLPGAKTAWVGYIGVVVTDPQDFGLEDEATASGKAISAGLVGLDLASGRTRLYTQADGLPEMTYADFGEVGKASVPFFDLAWVDADKTFVAASWTHLVKGAVDANGQATAFSGITLRAAGQGSDAAISRVVVAGGEIFVGTDQGVAVLDAQTFALTRWLDLGVERAWVYGLAAGELRGPAVAVLYATSESEPPSQVALATPGKATTAHVQLPGGASPLAVGGMGGRMLVGVKDDTGRGEVLAAVTGPGGVRVQSYVGADQFKVVSTKEKPFLPGIFAVDAVHQSLVVGGVISNRDPGASGGLVSFHLDADGNPDGALQPAIPREDPYFWLMPWQVDTLRVDGLGRWWITGRQLCDERRARQMGLVRLEQDGKERRLVRPLVSGVHAITVDPAAGHTWLSLRDENAGLACEGNTVQSGVCRLKADGSCELYAPNANDDDSPDSTFILPDMGPVRVAFGTAARKQMAIATRHNATVVRNAEGLTERMTQFEPGVSLLETSVAWSEGGALWIGSEAEWSEAPVDPNDPDPIDWVKVNDRGPHGLGYLAYQEDVPKDQAMRRYSRNKSDIAAWDVPGMPSNVVWDVLPLAGKQHALAALGIERMARTYEHVLGDEATSHAKGGLAEVEGDSVHVIAPPAGVTFGDVVALARGDDGRLFALDAKAGVVELDLGAHASHLILPASWTGDERGLSLAVDGTHLAVGTNRAIYVFGANGGVTKVPERKDGAVWSLRFASTGVLYAGTDRGLVRVALDGAQLPAALGPAELLAREPWTLKAGCDGAIGCRCHGDDTCAYGSECQYQDAMNGFCQERVDPCAHAPYGEQCACSVDGDCGAGLECACGGNGSCLCAPATNGCGGTAGCACSTDGDCASGFHCESGIAGSSCVEGPPACALHCTCSTSNGCPSGMTCQGGFAGNSCR